MQVLKTNKAGRLSALFFIVLMGGTGMYQNIKTTGKVNNYKTEILKRDSARFQRTQEQIMSNMNVYSQEQIWEDSYNRMQDSFRIVGNAQRSYVEGINDLK